ncbi:hypothetical protein WMY93_000893 [Mugilogobius chulae]|uniref:Protein wntless homolog n=1 Tax=Mugilogobius chulae TaxID=88201 RepID=A0AAW0Q3S5_9GOBI
MAGAIIENMSTKKLVIVGVILLLFQAFAFMVGGLIAPSPPQRALPGHQMRGHGEAASGVQVVHAVGTEPLREDPVLRRGHGQAHRSQQHRVLRPHPSAPQGDEPWFQFMLVILQFDIAFKMHNQIEDGALVTIDVGLAYRDDTVSEWTEMAHSFEQRKLSCNFTTPKTFENEGRYYECDLLPFMEVGSVAHKYYLVNIRLPVNERKKINVGIGEIKDIRLVGIHQNGGFTKVWFAMKTFLTPSIFIIMVWYWRRITLMSRPPVLLEKMILALGISMTFINIPLLDHLLRRAPDGSDGEKPILHLLEAGWAHRLGSFCLFIFDMCERGVQLTNPFYSIWASEVGTELAMAFIIVAGICACLYFLFLCFMVFQVFRNISGKRTSLPAMSKARRLHYEGLIFRFKFLMLVTLTCAAMTVIFFIISQVNEGHWHWGEHTVQVNSAFFTGIYGMWNLYVFAIMFLYAPSHKRYGDEQTSGQCITGDTGANSGEDIQLTTTITHVDGPTEIYKMTGKEAQE